MDSKDYAENSYADIPSADGIVPPQGKTFVSWFLPDGTRYYPGDKVRITGNLTLTADYYFTSLKTSITWHSNYPADSGWENTTDADEGQDNNTAITLEKAGFTAPEGYYFAGWNSRADGSGETYAVGTKIGIDNNSVNHLYAVWAGKKEITLKANSGTATYDGAQHTASGVETDQFTVDGVIYTVSGYSTEDPAQTNAGTYTNNISGTYVVKNGDVDVTDRFIVKTENGLLTIRRRKVILTSQSASKPYDGKPLTAPEVTAAGDGFVTGEVSEIKATGTITKTGSVTNTITCTESSGFKAGNYEISRTEGTLTVTKNSAEIIITAKDAEKKYDGTPLTEEGAIVDGLPEGFTAEVTTAGSLTDVGIEDNKVDSVIIRKGEEDVTDQFSGLKKVDGMLTINKRTVKLKSESASKPYGGKPLTAPEVTVTGDGFVTGEVSDIKATGTITKVGSVPNSIVYTPASLPRVNPDAAAPRLAPPRSTFKADNYSIELDEGILTITENEDEIVVNAQNAAKVYDGTELKNAGYDVIGLPEGHTAEAAVTGTITNAGTAENAVGDVVIRNADGEDVTDQFSRITKNSGMLTITKRTVNLSSASASRPYDGTAMTAPEVTVTGDGFVDGEVSSLTATGTITLAGSVPNTITYQEGESFRADNYEITKKEGTLAITDDVPADKVISKTHDGKAYTTGDTVDFRIRVKNIYNERKTITILEQDGVIITGQSVFRNVEPGAVVETTAQHTLTQKEVLSGSYTNTASARFDGGKSYDGDDTVGRVSHLTIRKTSADSGRKYGRGETIVYTITAVNDGTADLTDVVVTDSLTGDTRTYASLRAGATESFQVEYVVTEKDILAGRVVNEATATAKDPGGKEPDVTPGRDEEKTEEKDSHLTVVKEVTNTPADGKAYISGEKVKYSITVTNDGNLTIRDITVTDPLTGNVGDKAFTIAALAPGESETFEAEYTVTKEDAAKGSVTNVAEASGTSSDPDEPEVDADPGKKEVKTAESAEKTTGAAKKPKPSKPAPSKTAPPTGDHAPILLYCMLLICAAGIMAGIGCRRRKEDTE